MLCVLIRVASNEYPHHMFLWRNKKYIDPFWLKEKKKKKKTALSGGLLYAPTVQRWILFCEADIFKCISIKD